VSSSETPSKQQAYELGRAVAWALSPRTRAFVVDWLAPAADLPLGRSLTKLRNALHDATDALPDWYDRSVAEICDGWDKAVRRGHGKLPLLMRSLWHLYATTSEQGFIPGWEHVFAQIAFQEFHERASFLEVHNQLKYDYSWFLRTLDLRGLSKAQAVAHLEEVVSGALTHAARDASKARRICEAGAKRMRSAMLDVRVSKFKPRPQPEDPNPVASELERVDPVARLVTDLVEKVWDWCAGRLGSKRRVLCRVGLYLWFLAESPIEIPKEPTALFPAAGRKACTDYQEPFPRYVHTFCLVESYWESANAELDLPAFGAPPGVSWDSLSTFEGLWGMCANVQSWAKQQHAAMPDYLSRSHLPALEVTGRLRSSEVEGVRHLPVPRPTAASLGSCGEKRDSAVAGPEKEIDVTASFRDMTSHQESHDERQTHAPRMPGANGSAQIANRPSRLWTHPWCPNCGLSEVEWLNHSEFARRCRGAGLRGPHRDTVSRRVAAGIYWADRTRKVPWCESCRAKTPEGEGRQPPVEGLPTEEYEPSATDKENIEAWALEFVKEHVDSDFDPELRQGDGISASEADEAYAMAFEAMYEKLAKSRGDLTRDLAIQAAEAAWEDFRRKADEVSRREGAPYTDLANRPADR